MKRALLVLACAGVLAGCSSNGAGGHGKAVATPSSAKPSPSESSPVRPSGGSVPPTDKPSRCQDQPGRRHGYLRVNYHDQQTPLPGLTIAFTDLTDLATLEVSQTANGCTTRTTKRFPTGEPVSLGDVELTVNSVNRKGGTPPSVSIEYKING